MERREALASARLDFLPPAMVNLSPEVERRAGEEAARLRTLYGTITPERLWHGRFARPVGGDSPGEGFGSRRIINGQPIYVPDPSEVAAAPSRRGGLLSRLFGR